ncbi:MAG TPA: hypothetical protein VIO61_06495 [Anaerolineaceae bacterium]
MIERAMAAKMISLAQKFQVIILRELRQSGETTLVRAAFPNFPYTSLEEPDIRQFALTDPRGFLSTHSAGGMRRVTGNVQYYSKDVFPAPPLPLKPTVGQQYQPLIEYNGKDENDEPSFKYRNFRFRLEVSVQSRWSGSPAYVCVNSNSEFYLYHQSTTQDSH